MAYSLTSANTTRLLLAAIATFAGAQGWTVEYNNAATSTGNGGQIALSSGNCHIAIGEVSSSSNPVAVTGGSDGRLYMALSTSINTGISQFWGHPGSIVTANNDTDAVPINDVNGPMTEVHFFGDDTFILCLIKSAPSRWTHFMFGNLDKKGMTHADIGFAYGMFHAWWDATGSTFPAKANLNDSAHQMWPLMRVPASGGRGSGGQLYIPDGVVDPSLGFTDGDLVLNSNVILAAQIFTTFNETNLSEVGTHESRFLDFMGGTYIDNQPTTGGLPLFDVPVVYIPSTSISIYLGDLPDVRLCNVTEFSAGQEVEYGSETYILAPWKQKGVAADVANGQPNTYAQGVAFKKVS